MRKATLSITCALALLSVSFSAAPAADFSDPTWPCIQRKVERLSLGLMWPHPVPETAPAAATTERAADLVSALVLRRVSLEDASARIAAFTEAENVSDPDTLGHVFKRVFDRIARNRSSIIKGIERYSLDQAALSDRIEEKRAKMIALEAVEEPDFDQIDAIEEQLDWDERIYVDRAKSLVYVCETPVLLEKRLYAIAQSMLQQVSD